MSQARLREALTSGGPSSKEKGPPVADGVLTVTPDTAEAIEWRSKRSLIDSIASCSTYLNEEDDGTTPSDLYGKFTWKIDKFNEVSKRELRSTTFSVGGYKWYILVYPQGCDVANHLSLFLCVADYDKLLPGWNHFAQFTIAVVNKDPRKSKYSDTLHRFCKKEHDWGWKKFMELGKIADGFIVNDQLIIKAQVQVIKDRPNKPFKALDGQYRRELIRVYLGNVEGLARRFVDEKREYLQTLLEASRGFADFWQGLDIDEQGELASEQTSIIYKGLTKKFLNDKEVTSTLLMDALYCGAKCLEELSRQEPAPLDGILIDSSRHSFFFPGDVVTTLTRLATETIPNHPTDKSSEAGPSQRNPQEGEEYSPETVERDERRLIDLGRRTVEVYAAAHIASTYLETALIEAETIRRQEALIREEEELSREEQERQLAKAEADKEKRAKKKEKQKKKKDAERAKKEAEEAEKLRLEELKREEQAKKHREAEERRRKEEEAREAERLKALAAARQQAEARKQQEAAAKAAAKAALKEQQQQQQQQQQRGKEEERSRSASPAIPTSTTTTATTGAVLQSSSSTATSPAQTRPPSAAAMGAGAIPTEVVGTAGVALENQLRRELSNGSTSTAAVATTTNGGGGGVNGRATTTTSTTTGPSSTASSGDYDPQIDALPISPRTQTLLARKDAEIGALQARVIELETQLAALTTTSNNNSGYGHAAAANMTRPGSAPLTTHEAHHHHHHQQQQRPHQPGAANGMPLNSTTLRGAPPHHHMNQHHHHQQQHATGPASANTGVGRPLSRGGNVTSATAAGGGAANTPSSAILATASLASGANNGNGNSVMQRQQQQQQQYGSSSTATSSSSSSSSSASVHRAKQQQMSAQGRMYAAAPAAVGGGATNTAVAGYRSAAMSTSNGGSNHHATSNGSGGIFRGPPPPSTAGTSSNGTDGNGNFTSPLPTTKSGSHPAAMESPGLDDFAHMGLITDLLE